MADLVTSPTNLAKYNACFAWGDFNQSSYVGHLESPSGNSLSKRDPRWIGLFLHRILQFCLEKSENSFSNAIDILTDLRTETTWAAFIDEIDDDQMPLSPLPEFSDFGETQFQDLRSLLFEMNNEYGRYQTEFYCEEAITNFKVIDGLIIRLGFIDFIMKVDYGGETEFLVIDWKSSVPKSNASAQRKFGVQMDIYWRWLSDNLGKKLGSDDPGGGTYLVPISRKKDSGQPVGFAEVEIDELSNEDYKSLLSRIDRMEITSGEHCSFCELVHYCPSDDGPFRYDLSDPEKWNGSLIPRDSQFIIDFSSRECRLIEQTQRKFVFKFDNPERKLTIFGLPQDFNPDGHHRMVVKLAKKIGAARNRLGVWFVR